MGILYRNCFSNNEADALFRRPELRLTNTTAKQQFFYKALEDMHNLCLPCFTFRRMTL
jgi:protein-tyrosine phosphatase